MVLMVIFLAGCTQKSGNSSSMEIVEGDPHMQAMFTQGVGPGKSPHYETPDFKKIQKIEDIAKDPADMPPPLNRDHPELVHVYLKTQEVIANIAPDISFNYWTFNGSVPGPFIRVRVGDTVELTLENDASSSMVHSIDLHAVTGTCGGASLTQVGPGQKKAFRFKALNPGLYVYHCASQNVPTHMSNGMYGLILVEPEGGLPAVDKEFYVMQGELYTKGQVGEKGFQPVDPFKILYEKPEYVIFNGRTNSLIDHSLKVNVGDNVRLYVGNGGVSLVSSFHVIGEIFDSVYHEAASEPTHNIQSTLIPAGGAAMTDFGIEVPGSYVIVDHSLARLDKGAWGALQAQGEQNPDVYVKVD